MTHKSHKKSKKIIGEEKKKIEKIKISESSREIAKGRGGLEYIVELIDEINEIIDQINEE